MNKLFSSIVIMCASLGISTGYSIKEIQVSNKIISQNVLNILKRLRSNEKLTEEYTISFYPSRDISQTNVPNPEYREKIKNLIIMQAFGETDEYRIENIKYIIKNILPSLYKEISDQEHLQSFSRFITSNIMKSKSLNTLLPKNLMLINIFQNFHDPEKIRQKSYISEEIRQSAFKGDSTIFDEIFTAPDIFCTILDNRVYNKGSEFSKEYVLQKIAEDLCDLVALSLILWYKDNPDSELTLPESVTVSDKIYMSDKIISQEVLSELQKLREENELTKSYEVKYHDTPYNTMNGRVNLPNPKYSKTIRERIIKQAFGDRNRSDGKISPKGGVFESLLVNSANIEIHPINEAKVREDLQTYSFIEPENYIECMKNIINECRNILSFLYNTTSEQKKTLKLFNRLIDIPPGNFTLCLDPKDVMYIQIKEDETAKNSIKYQFEEIRQSAFEGDPTIFDKIFTAPDIWYSYHKSTARTIMDKGIEKTIALQTIAEDLCHLVALSLMLWYNDNPDSELVLSTSEG